MFVLCITALAAKAAAITRYKRAEGQLQKRVYGLPARIDGRHTRRRYNSQLFFGLRLYVFKKGGLTRTSLTRKKKIFLRIAYK